MDFKKAYEEALERAKGIYNENPSSSTAKFVCGQIFPEIKESEDERIRKELWEYFHDIQLKCDNDFSPSFTIDDILAYLEKHKEQKPIQTENEREYVRTLKSLISDFIRGKDEVDTAYYQKIYDWLDGRHIEQEPAETSNIDLDTKVNDWIGYMLNDNAQSYSRKNVQIMLDNCARFFYDYAVMCLDKSAEWSGDDDAALDYLNELIGFGFTKNFFDVQTAADMRKWVNKRLKFIRHQPAKSPLAEGVYYIKDGQPVAEYEDGVETDRLLVIGKYCRFYLSMKDLSRASFKDAQEKAAALGEGWRCPDSFEGRTIGLASDEIRKKAGMLGATHFDKLYWFWTNEQIDRWRACNVGFSLGDVYRDTMDLTVYVLALSAFQN